MIIHRIKEKFDDSIYKFGEESGIEFQCSRLYYFLNKLKHHYKPFNTWDKNGLIFSIMYYRHGLLHRYNKPCSKYYRNGQLKNLIYHFYDKHYKNWGLNKIIWYDNKRISGINYRYYPTVNSFMGGLIRHYGPSIIQWRENGQLEHVIYYKNMIGHRDISVNIYNIDNQELQNNQAIRIDYIGHL